jgi:hypothetical protein
VRHRLILLLVVIVWSTSVHAISWKCYKTIWTTITVSNISRTSSESRAKTVDHAGVDSPSLSRQRIIENLRSMPFAPSAQIRSVPGTSVGQEIGSATRSYVQDDDIDFELDAKIRGKLPSLQEHSENR